MHKDKMFRKFIMLILTGFMIYSCGEIVNDNQSLGYFIMISIRYLEFCEQE